MDNASTFPTPALPRAARNAPRVSVIVPNYNHSRYLKRRLDSVLDQTFRDFELIYLDDASTDDSEIVFAQWKANRPEAADIIAAHVVNAANSGSPFVQWNRGVRASRGEYVWIAEADDMARPGLLAALVRVLDANPQAGLAYCHTIEIDGDDREIGLYDYGSEGFAASDWAHDFVRSGADEICAHLAFKNTIPNASAVLLRRDLYNRLGGADETMRLNGDWRLWLAFARHADIAFVAEPLNRFRRHRSTVRAASGRAVREAGELYAILGDVAPILSKAPREAREKLHGFYAEVLLSQMLGRTTPWRVNREVYRTARRLDPSIAKRLLLALSNRVAEKLGVGVHSPRAVRERAAAATPARPAP